MKIKSDSKAYKQIKKCFEAGQEQTKQTLQDYVNDGLTETRYLWDMLWSGLKVKNMRLSYRDHIIWRKHDLTIDYILLPEDSNDIHVQTALKHILKEQQK